MNERTGFASFLLSLKACCQEIDRGQPRPFYLIHGGHEYFVEWATTNLLDHLLPGSSREENLAVFDCRERNIDNAPALTEGQSRLFGHGFRQVLLVKNPPLSGAEAKGFLDRFLADPAPGKTVIIATSHAVPAGAALLTRLSDQGAILRAPRADSSEKSTAFLDFLATMNAKSKVKADLGVLQEVLIRVGAEEPRQLVREMEKLSLYVGPSKAATLQDVQEIVTECAPETAFALLEQIAEGKTTQALATVAILLEQKVPHPVMIGAIGQELRRLLQARIILDSGEVSASVVRGGFDRFTRTFDEERRRSIVQKFPPERRDNLFLHHPYVVYRCLRQALSLNQTMLAGSLEAVVEADFQLKTSPRPESQILERLILQLSELFTTTSARVS